jgi:hypothetical protein
MLVKFNGSFHVSNTASTFSFRRCCSRIGEAGFWARVLARNLLQNFDYSSPEGEDRRRQRREVKEILLNPSTLWEGYKAREAEVTEQKTRLIQQLETVLNLKDKAATKLEALTNAYLDPDIGMPKAEYVRRRPDIEKEITDWEREAQEIQRRLEAEAITQERMQAIEEFAAEVAQGIELVDFEEKQKVLRMLQVRVRCTRTMRSSP